MDFHFASAWERVADAVPDVEAVVMGDQRWTWSQVPYDFRSRYNLNSNDRYYYRDGYLYSVDPRTRLVEQVIRAIL